MAIGLHLSFEFNKTHESVANFNANKAPESKPAKQARGLMYSDTHPYKVYKHYLAEWFEIPQS